MDTSLIPDHSSFAVGWQPHQSMSSSFARIYTRGAGAGEGNAGDTAWRPGRQLPAEFLDLIALYPQPVRRQPTVEYLPERRRAEGVRGAGG